MSAAFKVELGIPENHWIRIELAHADHAFSVDVSYTPCDSVADLAQAVAKIAKGADDAALTLLEGQSELEVEFRGAGDLISVNVTSYPNHYRMVGTGTREFGLQASRKDVCLAFWRALRRLESRMDPADFERAWGHPFPSKKVQELTQIMKQMKAR